MDEAAMWHRGSENSDSLAEHSRPADVRKQQICLVLLPQFPFWWVKIRLLTANSLA